jgi:hypothetical protein
MAALVAAAWLQPVLQASCVMWRRGDGGTHCHGALVALDCWAGQGGVHVPGGRERGGRGLYGACKRRPIRFSHSSPPPPLMQPTRKETSQRLLVVPMCHPGFSAGLGLRGRLVWVWVLSPTFVTNTLPRHRSGPHVMLHLRLSMLDMPCYLSPKGALRCVQSCFPYVEWVCTCVCPFCALCRGSTCCQECMRHCMFTAGGCVCACVRGGISPGNTGRCIASAQWGLL